MYKFVSKKIEKTSDILNSTSRKRKFPSSYDKYTRLFNSKPCIVKEIGPDLKHTDKTNACVGVSMDQKEQNL